MQPLNRTQIRNDRAIEALPLMLRHLGERRPSLWQRFRAVLVAFLDRWCP
jgi:hypothetical protein